MGFIDTSVTTASSNNSSPATLAAAQSAVVKTAPTVSMSTTSAINSVVASANKTVSGITSGLASVASGLGASSSSITNALSSISSAFSTNSSSLAKGIDSLIGNVFGNTNNPLSSTTATKISDPTATNLTPPKSTSFTLGSLQAGSQSVSMSGAASSFGSLSSLMTGTSLSTVLNRYNLTSANTLNTTVGNASSGSVISSLFTDLSSVSNVISKAVSPTTSVGTSVNKISNTVTVGGTSTTTPATSSPINAISNDIASFAGLVAPVVSALSGSSVTPTTALSSTSLSSYYLSGSSSTPTLMTSTGTLVNTNGSGVDSVTANSILSLANSSGCATNIQPYSSYQTTASMFNAGLSLASANGMTDIIQSMIGCSTATTPLGQQALTNAFTSSASTQIGSASTILTAIMSPASLNTPALTSSIITNPSLTAADVSTVNSVMSLLGTTPTNAMSVPAASSSSFPVTDLSIISQTNPSFSNAVLGDSSVNDYLSGYQMSTAPDGSLACYV